MEMTSRQKTVFKTISYRVFSVMITFIISLYFTGSFKAASAIVSIDAAIKMGFYYYHERLWSSVYKKFKASKMSKKGMESAHKQ